MLNPKRLYEIIKTGEIILQQAEHLLPYQDETPWDIISWEDEIGPLKEKWCNDVLFFLEDEFGRVSKAYLDFESSYRCYCQSIDDELECIKEGLAVLHSL